MKQSTKSRIYTLIKGFFFILLVGLALALILILGTWTDGTKDLDCDYDSCSQLVNAWEFNGLKCFDKDNLECKDFLRLWEVCEQHKEHVGVC